MVCGTSWFLHRYKRACTWVLVFVLLERYQGDDLCAVNLPKLLQCLHIKLFLNATPFPIVTLFLPLSSPIVNNLITDISF